MTDRTRAIRYAAISAVAVFALIGLALDKSELDPPFWITTPSAAAVFGLVFTVYDRYLWRKRFFGLRLSPIPDLNGKWTGLIDILQGERRREEGLRDVPCFIQVSQTWSKISVHFETPFTVSTSSMASIRDRDFHYEYHVRPKEGTEYPPDMGTHDGMARLHSSGPAWVRLEGDFFNDRQYQRFGRYMMERAGDAVTLDSYLEAIGYEPTQL